MTVYVGCVFFHETSILVSFECSIQVRVYAQQHTYNCTIKTLPFIVYFIFRSRKAVLIENDLPNSLPSLPEREDGDGHEQPEQEPSSGSVYTRTL